MLNMFDEYNARQEICPKYCRVEHLHNYRKGEIDRFIKNNRCKCRRHDHNMVRMAPNSGKDCSRDCYFCISMCKDLQGNKR